MCMYIYIYIYIYIFTIGSLTPFLIVMSVFSARVCFYAYEFLVHAYVCTCMLVWACGYIYIYIYIYIYMHTHIGLQYVCACMLAWVCTCTCTYTHILAYSCAVRQLGALHDHVKHNGRAEHRLTVQQDHSISSHVHINSDGLMRALHARVCGLHCEGFAWGGPSCVCVDEYECVCAETFFECVHVNWLCVMDSLLCLCARV